MKSLIQSIYWLFTPFLRRLKARKGKSLSEYYQDLWVIREALPTLQSGFFVDVGAADGYNDSNTFLLENAYGWKGLCVEANPFFYERLCKNRKVPCINVCISDQKGSAYFITQGLQSKMVSEEEIEANQEGVHRLKADTLANILRDANAPKNIDYLSLDIEGAEDLALGEFPFDEWTFKSITIERPSRMLHAKLLDNDYVFMKSTPGVDFFYMHKQAIIEQMENQGKLSPEEQSAFLAHCERQKKVNMGAGGYDQ